MNMIKVGGLTINLAHVECTYEGGGSYTRPDQPQKKVGQHFAIVFSSGRTIGLDGEDAELVRAHFRAASVFLAPTPLDLERGTRRA